MTLLCVEKLPLEEMQRRHALCRELCLKIQPKAGGILLFSRLSIYYLTGTYADGIFWLPMDGQPLLFMRHATDNALERALCESPLSAIHPLPAWDDLEGICRELHSPLSTTVAAEKGALPWNMAMQVQNALAGHDFVAADAIILQARSRKSAWELQKMRIAGARHHHAIYELLPQKMHSGMSERDLAHVAWETFFSLGHSGMNRMGNFGEECFLGHIAAGDNGNYPSHFNGPLGLKGEHPAIPFMGDKNTLWEKNQILAMDIGFSLEGYHTDKTQVYFSGKLQNMPLQARKAHEACIEIQQRAAERLRPGAIPSEIWEEAKASAQRLGIEEGFMAIGDNKVPFLGHGIGLVIDEYPVIATRFDAPLEKGMTLAIEPKVGIAGLGMVGVENTFEVTDAGGISLSGTQYDIVEVE